MKKIEKMNRCPGSALEPTICGKIDEIIGVLNELVELHIVDECRVCGRPQDWHDKPINTGLCSGPRSHPEKEPKAECGHIRYFRYLPGNQVPLCPQCGDKLL